MGKRLAGGIMAAIAAGLLCLAPAEKTRAQQQGGTIILQGGGQLQIVGANGQVQIIGANGPMQIIVGANGQLILVPAQNSGPVELPIVSNGFADDQNIAGPITPLVQALEAASYQTRQAASEALMRLPPERLQEVVETIKTEKDEEALARLTDVAAHLFLKPRTYLKSRTSLLGVWYAHHDPSLLGVKFEPGKVRLPEADEADTMTVLVTEIEPGFPAMQTLHAGDRIVAINGEGFPIDMQDDGFRARVTALWPGAEAAMVVLREGKLVEVKVQTTCVPLELAAEPQEPVVLEQLKLNRTAQLINDRTMALATFMQTLKPQEKNQTSAKAQTAPPDPMDAQLNWKPAVPAPNAMPAPR
jgi:hypothetical protein